MTTHTIGEVLNQLRDEFDDITISKIRFLESEGLINPDRTESGYRKFTPGDIDRLRYVLRAQRDRYLPLKVIREELDRLDAGLSVQGPAQGQLPVDEPGASVPGSAPAPVGEHEAPAAAVGVSLPSREVVGDQHLDTEELAAAADLEVADIAALVEHGLLGAPPYDTEAVTIATLAGQLLGGGLEPRHLRMYRQFVERELSLAEQLITPLLRQRNPDSRTAAGDQADLLASAGAALHRALLVRRLRGLLTP
ncbi:MAG: MerR family transcriptional regulator [Nitriliruptor sp.]|nr:MAG: MerR family transcriptional regulator [Nitriliruptor sp.]